MTINLEQARKLCELGVEVKAEKDWRHDYKGDTTIVRNYGGTRQPQMGVSYLSAYNAEELSAMLRGDLEIVRSENATYYTFCLKKDVNGVEYWGQVNGATLTEALGNKLIHDIENNIITIEDINK